MYVVCVNVWITPGHEANPVKLASDRLASELRAYL